MNENNELLKIVYENAEMGSYTTTTLINLIKNTENKIKCVLESEIKEFEKYMKKSSKILEENGVKPKNSSMMAKLGSDMGIRMETIKDNSDAALAQMLIEGLTMGVVELESKIKSYDKVAEKNVIKLSNQYLKFLTNEVTKLKDYL